MKNFHCHSRLAVLLVITTVLTACSTYDAVRIVTSKDPGQAIENTAKYRVNSYKTNPLALARDVRRLVSLLQGNVDREWGQRERVLPSSHQYVKYTQNYKSRAIINFDSGEIRVETVATEEPLQSLHNAIVTTLLTPDDPRAVDLYSDRTHELRGRPYLAGFVVDQHGRYISDPVIADQFAGYLLQTRLDKRTITSASGKQEAYRVSFRMVNDHEDIRAHRYAGYVDHYANKFGLSKSLVYAIIKTESNFNPFAVSAAPAYGLMQLVPTTGGRDAFRHVKGYDHVPSSQYLFDEKNNIELGTGYLNILNYRYLGQIRDPLSREYCTIAAYNTGAGNVLESFSRDRDHAVQVINNTPPAEVYRHLRTKLRHAEARRYLHKVTEARRHFARL